VEFFFAAWGCAVEAAWVRVRLFKKREGALALQERAFVRRVGLGGFRALVVLAAFSPLGAWADQDVAPVTAAPAPTPGLPELRRELGGHLFIPSKFTDDPFVSTYVASETGVGTGWAPGRTYEICNGVVCPGPGTVANYQVGAFAQVLNYQYGFLDWWAVRVGAQLVVYSGTNSTGIVGVGTNANTAFTAGTTMSFKVGENLRLGGSFDFKMGPAIFLNIVQGVLDSIKTGEVVTPVNSYTQVVLNPAFVGAWSISRLVGLTFNLSYQYTHGSSEELGATANLFGTNVLFDFDLNSVNVAPIGFLGGFATNFSVDSTKFLQFRYQFGIMYTGVRALDVGLEVLYNRAPVVGNTNIFLSSLLALIVIQYNFN
jgi:hypothetical protein